MFLKKIVKSKIAGTVISFLISFYIKLVKLTSKTEFLGDKDILKPTNAPNKNLIFAFWHGRELMMPIYLRQYTKNQHNVFSIVSRHRDGKMVGKILKSFGSKLIYGSSTKGGTKAIREIIKNLKDKNQHLCISVDGPTGPSMKITGAIIDIARMTNATIIPISCSFKKAKILSSWDSFMVPKLFNHIKIQIAKPLKIPKKLDKNEIETQKQMLENILNKMTFALDKEFGHKIVEIGKIKKKEKEKNV